MKELGVRSEVLTAVSFKIIFIWIITLSRKFREKHFYRINTSNTTEDVYRFTPHFFPKYCNIKEEVSLNCTLNAHWKRCKVCDSLSWPSDRVKLSAPDFFKFLAHPVYKMWIIQEPNTLELWNKLHFEKEKNREYIPCLKYSVPIFVE